jgi:hypothetical protein
VSTVDERLEAMQREIDTAKAHHRLLATRQAARVARWSGPCSPVRNNFRKTYLFSGRLGSEIAAPISGVAHSEPMSEPYIAYREQLLDRHQNAATSVLSTVGDVVMVGGIAAGVATRRVAVGAAGLGIGVAIAVVAHLFQPGTVREEIAQVARHPIWAVRADMHRIFRRSA